MADGGWSPFDSPGAGPTAAERIELAEIQAGYGPRVQQEERKRKTRRRRRRRREAEQPAIIEETPYYQDPRVIGGSLVLVGLLGAYWYTRKK